VRSLVVVPVLVVLSACGASGRGAANRHAPAAVQPGPQPTRDAAPPTLPSSNCVSANVVIRVRRAAGARPLCMGTRDCPYDWLALSDPSGRPLFFDYDWALRNCDQCEYRSPPDVDRCGSPFELPAEGMTRGWNGTAIARSSCGSPAVACSGLTCARAGRYTAKACGYTPRMDHGRADCWQLSANTAARCAEVAFDVPTNGPVEITIP
jgi:hypothetical protein